jgi:hypothetical protein
LYDVNRTKLRIGQIMDDPRTLTDNDSERRLQLRRRAKRGLVASYIREISGRRNGAGPHQAERPQEPIELAERD